ncbi:methionine--tRNA ligase [Malassezia brasiliensis]|uniref:Probable methionine--tRNA ligase, mitochondrial n=1 Tax=Malassezia brasiliensis TaxID=1821822 RepID=A0AAF0DVU7_9BASI|nr:methionine--tRNA ligase [Malassezia brasiliensis]
MVGAAIGGRRWVSNKPYYVTTPIFYVNAEPHIGHLHSDVLADVLCRYQTLRTGGWTRNANGVYPPPTHAQFATGTDEHGMKVQRVAESQNVSPRALCDRVSQRFRALADEANIAYTRFIRTTDSDHAVAVASFWQSLVDRGHVYLGQHEGWYAVSDEAFYPDAQVRQVTRDGETWHESIETGQRVEWTAETNYKFRLSAFQAPLLAWLEANPRVVQPRGMYERVLSEVREGLSDLSISRPRARLHWGIPVPNDAEHTMYVWVDALINYLTAVGYTGGAPPPAWPADVHVVGKDIVRFHAIYWPALLMAAGLPLPHTVVAHAHWTVERSKMSKSRGNSVNPFEALAKYGTDTIRCFLMRAGGNLSSDADYSEAQLQEFQRKYLQGQLGNLLSRVLAPKIQARLVEHAVPDAPLAAPALVEADAALVEAIAALPARFDAHMDAFELSRALQAVFEVLALANEYVQRAAPWSPATPVDGVHRAVHLACEALRVCGVLLQAIMPDAMDRLLNALQVAPAERTFAALLGADGAWSTRAHTPVRAGATKIAPLFPRVP